MADGSGSAGVAVVAVVAGLTGVLHVALGSTALVAGDAATAGAVLALARVVLGGTLLPAAVGLLGGAPWSRYLGVVAFGGLAVVGLLGPLSGATLAVPLAGVFLAGACALYLLFAPGEFGTDDGRPIDEDSDPHDFVR